jgi:hypothetical protein
MNESDAPEIQELLSKVAQKERLARKRAVLYAMVPMVVAAILVVWTGRYLNRAKRDVDDARQEVEQLRNQRDLLNKQMGEVAGKLIDIATVARQMEGLVESKKSYLRSPEEARLLIDIRIKFDSLNTEIVGLSETFPAVRTIGNGRKWVTVVKSNTDLKMVEEAAPSWIADYGAQSVAVYRTPNGFYALALLGDGSFTQAYSRTVSLIKSGRATDAYFEDAGGWGVNLLH